MIITICSPINSVSDTDFLHPQQYLVLSNYSTSPPQPHGYEMACHFLNYSIQVFKNSLNQHCLIESSVMVEMFPFHGFLSTLVSPPN